MNSTILGKILDAKNGNIDKKHYKINNRLSSEQFNKLLKSDIKSVDMSPCDDVSAKINIPTQIRDKSGIYFIHAQVNNTHICYVGISTEFNTRINAHSHNSNCTWLLTNIDNARMDWLYVSPVIMSRFDLEPLESFWIDKLSKVDNVILLNDTMTKYKNSDSLGMIFNGHILSDIL